MDREKLSNQEILDLDFSANSKQKMITPFILHYRRREILELVLGTLLTTLLITSDAHAFHMIWLDFSNFSLNSFASVNGNSPPTAAATAAVQRQIVANMVEDYATFDVQFSTVQPANGRNTRVRFLAGTGGGTFFGCAGPNCCSAGGACTGIGTWNTVNQSSAEIYVGNFASDPNWQGNNATTARIANGISHTASHELGHVMGLTHCDAADDRNTQGCANIFTNSADQNALWHIMADGLQWSLPNNLRPTRDRFFSVHVSRGTLQRNVQARNHWNPLPNLNGGFRSDLTYGRFISPLQIRWYGRLSQGTQFGSWKQMSDDAGDAGDIILTGDVSGDGRSDLVYGRFISSTQVRWFVRLSTVGGEYGDSVVWQNNAGNVGDIFRLADVDGDSRADLLYGRPLSATQVQWYVRRSTGGAFGNWELWRNDAGDEGDIFLVGDVDADGRSDLVYGRQISTTQTKWYVRLSTGNGFTGWWTWRNDAGDTGDLFYLGDGDGDGDADLIYGRIIADNQVRWWFRPAAPHPWFNDPLLGGFGAVQTWRNDAGDAGDLFRIGDGSGDGRVDLYYGRPRGMTSLTAAPNLAWVRWFGRTSSGAGFGPWSVWRNDAGDEGDIFP